MQSRVLLCAFLVFEHMTKHMCHTQADRNVFFHQHTKKKKKHGDALIEVRVNSLTWYSNSFNIYRTFSPHEMAAVVFLFFFNFERNWYQLCVCVYDDGCIHCCSWSTLIYMHVNGLEYECHCSTSTAIFVAYFFFPQSLNVVLKACNSTSYTPDSVSCRQLTSHFTDTSHNLSEGELWVKR